MTSRSPIHFRPISSWRSTGWWRRSWPRPKRCHRSFTRAERMADRSWCRPTKLQRRSGRMTCARGSGSDSPRRRPSTARSCVRCMARSAGTLCSTRRRSRFRSTAVGQTPRRLPGYARRGVGPKKNSAAGQATTSGLLSASKGANPPFRPPSAPSRKRWASIPGTCCRRRTVA